MTMHIEQPMQQAPADELSALAQSIVNDQRRIGAMPNPNPASLTAEIAGTLLSYDRDIAGYLARFEQSVIANFEAMFAMIGELQENASNVAAEAAGAEGTQFEPDDAVKFADFIQGARVLIEATKNAPGTVEPAKSQLEKMLSAADELLKIIDENTLVDDDEVEEDDATSDVQAQS